MNFNFNKKFFVFLLIVLIIIFSVVWVTFKKIDGDRKKIENEALKENQLMLETQKKTIKPVEEKIKGFTYTPSTEKTCLEKGGEEQKNCLSYLKADDAYAKKDTTLCLLIDNKEIKYYCLDKIVREKRDVKICKLVDDIEFEKQCFHQIAFLDSNPELCKDENKFEEKECLGPILAFKASATGKLEECKKINILEYANLCFERIINGFHRDCRRFENEGDQIACQDIVLFEDAMEVNNIKLCDLITDVTRKKVCQNILDKGSNVDSDGDGLADGKELWFTTNPFNPDTDGDGLSDGDELKKYETNPADPDTDGDGHNDGEEIKNGFDPNGPGKLNTVNK